MIKVDKKNVDKVTEAVKVARENGMTYAQLQKLETEGKAVIKDGKLILKKRALRRA